MLTLYLFSLRCMRSSVLLTRPSPGPPCGLGIPLQVSRTTLTSTTYWKSILLFQVIDLDNSSTNQGFNVLYGAVL